MLNEILDYLFSNLLFLALHLEKPNVFPKPLSPNEEKECFIKMSQGDKEARNKLIEHNLRLVAHIIKKYYSVTQEQDDLISIGTVGLIKAVSSYDYNKGNRFATYASKCIENEILMHFRSLKKASGELHFDNPIDSDKDGNQLTLMDIVSDDDNVCDAIELKIRSHQLYGFIEKALDRREAEIVILRFGLYNKPPLTQREVAKKLDISRSYVSRIEKKALEKLKNCYEPSNNSTKCKNSSDKLTQKR